MTLPHGAPVGITSEVNPWEVDDSPSDSVVGRALRVLNEIGSPGTVCGVSELARRARLPKSTVYRIVSELVEAGYVRRVGAKYALSHHMFPISSRSSSEAGRNTLRAIAAPHLGALFLQTGLAVNLGILLGSDVVYMSQLQGPRTPLLPAGPGGRMPASATALGKALLAFTDREQLRSVLASPLPALTRKSITTPGRLLEELKAARTTGLSYDHQEASIGLTCIGAAVIVPGQPTVAVSVSGPARQLDLGAVALQLRRTVTAITYDLTASGVR